MSKKFSTALVEVNGYLSYRNRYELVLNASDYGMVAKIRSRNSGIEFFIAEGRSIEDAIVKLSETICA
jgi:hypothetical protein